MKTIIKNKQSYLTKIGCPGTSICDCDNQDPSPTHSSGSQQAGGSASSIDEASDGSNNSTKGDHDSIQGESSTEEDSTSAGSVGMKRKAMGSSGSGRKGKQRKV